MSCPALLLALHGQALLGSPPGAATGVDIGRVYLPLPLRMTAGHREMCDVVGGFLVGGAVDADGTRRDESFCFVQELIMFPSKMIITAVVKDITPDGCQLQQSRETVAAHNSSALRHK